MERKWNCIRWRRYSNSRGGEIAGILGVYLSHPGEFWPVCGLSGAAAHLRRKAQFARLNEYSFPQELVAGEA